MKDKFFYARHVMFRPFDGFYDLKHERKGSWAVTVTIMVCLIIVNIMRRQLTGFTFNSLQTENLNVMSEILGVLVVYFMFCLANWAMTTLMDGEGSFGNILMYTAYSLTPMIIFGVVFIVLSNVLVIAEIVFLQLVNAVAALWSAFLLFVGTLTTHQYTIKKTILTFILILIVMLLMLFLFALLFALYDRIAEFIRTIFKEISLRR
jgi:hypothetical protein